MDDRKEQSITQMVNSVRAYLIVVDDRREVAAERTVTEPTSPEEEREEKKEKMKQMEEMEEHKVVAANAAAISRRESIVHRRLALGVVTASGRTGLSCVKEVCRLLLDSDTSVALVRLFLF